MQHTPTANGSNGRGPDGRFLKGNPGGPGNPYARRVAQFRAALLARIKVGDLRAIADRLVEQAKAGDLLAIREVLNRTVGHVPKHVDRLTETLERGAANDAITALVVDRLVRNLEADFAPEARPALRDWLMAAALGSDGGGRR